MLRASGPTAAGITAALGGAPAVILSGTSVSIGGGALLAGAVATNTVSITGVSVGMTVFVTPNTYPGDAIDWRAYVSAANTVTVVVSAIIAATPIASTYNVRVVQ